VTADGAFSFLAPCAIIAMASIPEYSSGRSAAGLAVWVVPLAVAVAASFAYVRRIDTRTRHE